MVWVYELMLAEMSVDPGVACEKPVMPLKSSFKQSETDTVLTSPFNITLSPSLSPPPEIVIVPVYEPGSSAETNRT